MSMAVWLTGAACAAAQSYDCRFPEADAAGSANLRVAESGWRMTFEDGAAARFDPVGPPRDGVLHLLSMDFDRDAGALALLTLDSDGRAFLSLHGHFPALDARTHAGTCRKENG